MANESSVVVSLCSLSTRPYTSVLTIEGKAGIEVRQYKRQGKVQFADFYDNGESIFLNIKVNRYTVA